MCDNRTVIMFFRYHWKFSRKKSLFTKKKKMYSTEGICYKSEHNAFETGKFKGYFFHFN